MNYYYIKPNTPSGNAAILTDKVKSYFSGDLSSYANGSLVLEMDSLDYHDLLFPLHPFYFVTKEFKEVIEKENKFNLKFQEVDVFLEGINLMDSHPDHGFVKDSFWRLIFDDSNAHVKLYSTMIVVSEVFLNYLISNFAFKYSFSGSHYGKEYEYLNNAFRI